MSGRTPLRQARAKAFLRYLGDDQIELNGLWFEDVREYGWTRRDVETAINDLVADGVARVDTAHRLSLTVCATHATEADDVF